MMDAFLGKLLSWHWKSVALTAFAGLSMASGIAAAQSQNPVDAIKDAWKKAKQQQKAGQPPQPAGAPQPGNPPPAGSPAPQPGNAPPTAVAAARPSTSSGVASAGGATIEETVVAPVQQGAIYSISSHGVHVGMISTSGSRAVVLYDNIPGPKFDAVFNNGSTGGIQFSPDGTRYAYCARAGK